MLVQNRFSQEQCNEECDLILSYKQAITANYSILEQKKNDFSPG